MKIHISCEDFELSKVTEVVELVRRLFPIGRTHPPKKKEDGRYHVYLQTVKD